MKKNLVWICGLTFLISVTTAYAKASEKPIYKTMSELGQTIALLNVDVFDDSLDSDTAKVDFKKSVGKMVQLFNEAKPHMQQRSIAYQISYEVMAQYLDDIQAVVNHGDIDLARGMLKTVPQLCAGCHTQDNQQKKLFPSVDPKSFKTDLQYADFSFITRDYDDAVKYYEKYLTSLENAKDEDIERALKKILVIYAQVKKEPQEGAKILTKYLSNNTINKSIREKINEWVKGLNELESSSIVDENSLQKRQAYIDYYLNQLKSHNVSYFASEKDKVFYMTLRGLLYEYLNNNPVPNDIPVVLYWLAVCDRTLEYSFFDNLADLYLKECILSYSNHPYARKCLNEYESYMKFAFTGSSGTYLPADISDEIEFLKSVVNRSLSDDRRTQEDASKKTTRH